jgi:hypothetical protein
MVRIILTIDFFFMAIFLEQRAPRPLYAPVNRIFASLDPSWCYRYTRFTNHQLQLLYELLSPPPRFIIQDGKCHCSPKEAFINMFIKLAKGGTNLGLQDLFGECHDQRILDTYSHTSWWLDDEAAGIFHQPGLEQWKDNFLPLQ